MGAAVLSSNTVSLPVLKFPRRFTPDFSPSGNTLLRNIRIRPENTTCSGLDFGNRRRSSLSMRRRIGPLPRCGSMPCEASGGLATARGGRTGERTLVILSRRSSM